MSEFSEKMACPLSDSDVWRVFDRAYTQHYLQADKSARTLPRRLHQVWLGSPLPDKNKRLRDTWLAAHPDWEYQLWTDADAQAFGMQNIDSFNRVANLAAKSDIFRYEILQRHGGVYFDTDVECFKSFDDLRYLDFFTGTGKVDVPALFIGLLGSIPNHPILAQAIAALSAVSNESLVSQEVILDTTGPAFFTRVVYNYLKEHPEDATVVFPTPFFYAVPGNKRGEIRADNESSREVIRSYLTSDSYCAHLWYCSWQDKEGL